MQTKIRINMVRRNIGDFGVCTENGIGINSMNRLINKLILFTLCTAAYIQDVHSYYMVVPLIVTISVSAFCEYVNRDAVKIGVFVAYVFGCTQYPALLFFLPMICYDICLIKPQWLLFLTLVPLFMQSAQLPPITIALIVIYIVLAFLMKRQTVTLENSKREYIVFRDNAKEISTRLRDKNKELLEKQDYEINLATLNERNRIAREMHDTVGHLLSSSILQLGALLATSKDDTQRESLEQLKNTLSKGMDSIRSSIHDLHDESIDLYAETQSVIANFVFCPVTFDYDIESSPDRRIKYAFLSIIKEALSNVARHSNATYVGIAIREHPALYQLIIRDNGTKKQVALDEGLGLKNIKDRVESLHGIVNISNQNGFVLFISVPKG